MLQANFIFWGYRIKHSIFVPFRTFIGYYRFYYLYVADSVHIVVDRLLVYLCLFQKVL